MSQILYHEARRSDSPPQSYVLTGRLVSQQRDSKAFYDVFTWSQGGTPEAEVNRRSKFLCSVAIRDCIKDQFDLPTSQDEQILV